MKTKKMNWADYYILKSMIIKKKKVLFAFHREKFVRYTEGITSEGAVEEMARMVAHELVHQWIGNLVTPEWWDEIWIKEGLAAFLAYKDRHQPTTTRL